MNSAFNKDSWVIESQLPIRFKIKNSPNLFNAKNTDLLEFGGTDANSRRLIVID